MARFKHHQSPAKSQNFMSHTLAFRRVQREEPAQDKASNICELESDVNGGFDELLDDFERLQIESPEPISDTGIFLELPGAEIPLTVRTKSEPGDHTKDAPEVGRSVRRDDCSRNQAMDQESDTAIFNTPAQIHEEYGARPQAMASAFIGPAKFSEMIREHLETALENDSNSTTSDESQDTHPKESEWIEILPEELNFSVGGKLQDQVSPESDKISGPSREIITKPDGSRFIVTSMHYLPEYQPINQRSVVESSFGTFSIKKLKSILRNKLRRNVPLDCITFTGLERYCGVIKRMTFFKLPCIPEEGLADQFPRTLQFHVEMKMTPEDWHRVLMLCDDDDWEDLDQLWRDNLPTVSSDFLCSICDASLPRPEHRRVRDLRLGIF